MDPAAQIAFLRRTVDVLPAMVGGLTDQQVRWKPLSGNWSVLEILGHMLAEEQQDFRLRCRSTLEDPNRPWPNYDPEGIVVAEKFNEKNSDDVLKERADSLEWLDSLVSPDWDSSYQHPRIGPLRAGDLFASWVVHDQLHIRQIAKRCFEMLCQDSQPYETRYAGDW